jgi:hypothetical protein
MRYRDGEGNITDRKISDIEPQDGGKILAFCHDRQETRTFKVSRIISIIDADTGEVVENIHALFGIELPQVVIPPEHSPDPLPKGTQAIKLLRNKEKRELFKPFKLAIIEEQAKKRFFGFFGGRCFKCGSPNHLVIDHHIPIILGGHLVPGNLVALCRTCNNRKADNPPELFYTVQELERLAWFIENQQNVFEFSFDYEAWEKDRASYLISLGIDAVLVEAVLTDPDHRFFIPQRDESTVGLRISAYTAISEDVDYSDEQSGSSPV